MNLAKKYTRDMYTCTAFRGVPIIGSANISASDMVLFTNIGIGEKQHND